MSSAHIIEGLTSDGATTFCGRTGQKTAWSNEYQSTSGKTFFKAFAVTDTENLNAYVNCQVCQRAYDAARQP